MCIRDRMNTKPKTIPPKGSTNISPYGTSKDTAEIVPQPIKKIKITQLTSGTTL